MRRAYSAKTPSWSIRPAGNHIDWPGAYEELLGEPQLADRHDPLAEVIAKEVIERAAGRARCRTDASVGSQEMKKQAASMIGGVLRDQAFFSCAGGMPRQDFQRSSAKRNSARHRDKTHYVPVSSCHAVPDSSHLKMQHNGEISMSEMKLKVSEKGGVSLYGLGRFPVTLYAEQWQKLLGEVENIKKFLEDNKALLKTKDAA